MKTILVYTGIFTVFQKWSPFTQYNGKRMSHDHSCTLGMRINVYIVIVYTVVKDTQSECGKPRPHFQKSLFWSVYTERLPFSKVFVLIRLHWKATVFKSLRFDPFTLKRNRFQKSSFWSVYTETTTVFQKSSFFDPFTETQPFSKSPFLIRLHWTRNRFQKSSFWSVYTETQPFSKVSVLIRLHWNATVFKSLRFDPFTLKRNRFQKSSFWSVYTETQPFSKVFVLIRLHWNATVFKSLHFDPFTLKRNRLRGLKTRSNVSNRCNRSKSLAV